MCILCGCDYTTNIPGVGPVKAFKYISEEGGVIENVIKRIEKENDDPKKKKKYTVPETFFYKEARELFRNPSAISEKAELEALIKFNKPDEEGLKSFLVESKGFNDLKVDNGIKKLKATAGKTNQARLDCFFKGAGTKTSSNTSKDKKPVNGGGMIKSSIASSTAKKSMPAKLKPAVD